MKRILSLSVFFLAALSGMAQTQRGIVRTIGRPNKPGQPIANVTVQMVGMPSAAVSGQSGEFSLNAFNKKDGDAFRLVRVRKQGYELQDKYLSSRNFVFSSRVPIVITMISTAQLKADKERIENNARRKAESNYQKQKTDLEKQLNNKSISAEKYRKELRELQEKYEKYMALVGDLADRYARTDYDNLDSIDYEINLCIEEGEMDKADSLIHTVFDPETVLERNRAAKAEVQARIDFAQNVINKATIEREAILRDIEYYKTVADLSIMLAEEYQVRGEKTKAIVYLEKAQEIQKVLYDENDETILKTEELIGKLKQ